MKAWQEILRPYEFISFSTGILNPQVRLHKYYDPKYWPPASSIQFYRSQFEIASLFPGHFVAFSWPHVTGSSVSNKMDTNICEAHLQGLQSQARARPQRACALLAHGRSYRHGPGSPWRLSNSRKLQRLAMDCYSESSAPCFPICSF